jgi:ketosteroid isomerase-like protein
MSMSMEGDTPEAAVREDLEALAQAIRDKDVDAVMTHYAPDIVVYDVKPPLVVQSAADYRRSFETWFASMQGPIDYEMNDLRISMSESHAFCHCQGHVKGTKVGGEKVDYWVRVTTCMQQANGQWLVGHEHVSMPATL